MPPQTPVTPPPNPASLSEAPAPPVVRTDNGTVLFSSEARLRIPSFLKISFGLAVQICAAMGTERPYGRPRGHPPKSKYLIYMYSLDRLFSGTLRPKEYLKKSRLLDDRSRAESSMEST